MKFLVKLLSKIYPYKLHRLFKSYLSIIQSRWLISQIPGASNSATIGRDVFILGIKYITLGEKTSIASHSIITAWDYYRLTKQYFYPSIVIGKNVSIGEYCHLTSINKIVIGDGVLTGRWVTITDNSHGSITNTELDIKPIDRPLYSKGEVVIERNVWIGDKVTILPGVHIGEGTIIAANSVVTKDIPSFCVAAGAPAKIIKQFNK